MDIRDGECHVYEQLKLLIEERRKLSRQCYGLKEYLIHLEEDKIVSDSSDKLSQETKFSNFKSEKMLQDYLIQREVIDTHRRNCKDYGLIIASILKESGKPLSDKQMYQESAKSNDIPPDYGNFINNILPKINRDDSISVERTVRGYWQYRNTP